MGGWVGGRRDARLFFDVATENVCPARLSSPPPDDANYAVIGDASTIFVNYPVGTSVSPGSQVTCCDVLCVCARTRVIGGRAAPRVRRVTLDDDDGLISFSKRAVFDHKMRVVGSTRASRSERVNDPGWGARRALVVTHNTSQHAKTRHNTPHHRHTPDGALAERSL